MNKLKALTAIMLGGLALASCTDKNNGEYSTRTSFTASASVGGCTISSTILIYTNPIAPASDTWEIQTDVAPQNQQGIFYANNVALSTTRYNSYFLCIPSAQVSYWS
jgi:hypothetical protein